jgi:hypothetical protein
MSLKLRWEKIEAFGNGFINYLKITVNDIEYIL